MLVLANGYFFLGLALYVQIRQGWFFVLSSAGALLVLLGAWWVQSPGDAPVAALFPGSVALMYLIGSLVCFLRASDRPDFFGKGVTLILVAGLGFAGAGCVALMKWPIQFG